MGGSSTKIKYKDFSCNGEPIPPKEPIKFTKLKHIRCLFFIFEIIHPHFSINVVPKDKDIYTLNFFTNVGLIILV
jgi:hypothetical protein